MPRTSIIAPVCLVGVFALFSAERIQASSSVHGKHVSDRKMYKERSGSKIEDWFRDLPSVENEVNGLFEDTSFLSSFGPAHSTAENPEEEVQALFRRILSSEESGRNLRKGFKTVPPITGRADITIPNDGEYTFSDFQPMSFEPVGNGGTMSFGSFESTSSSNFQPVESAGNMDFIDGGDEPSTPISLMSSNWGEFSFNFPTIQHTVYSGPINLKAQSSMDLTSMDPEIFDVVQSILTPFLQGTVGDSLISYNLEIDYAPGRSGSSGNNVVTLMEVKCSFKVISDSLDSFLSTNHVAAKQWLFDFFSGPGGYNVQQLVGALQSNDIPVTDIAFLTENFNMGNTVSQANSQSFGNGSSSSSKNNDNAPSGAAMVVVTLSVLFAGILLFMHYTGRLPSKAEIGEFSLNTRDSIKHHSINARDSLKNRMPATFELLKRRRGGDDNEGGGRRRRTFSGTFRRFPTGGLKKAAIQKKPAESQQYLGDSESTSAKLSQFEEYSFSRYGGDYAPSTPSRKSSMPPMTPMSRMSGDEFSMPDGYDSVHERSKSNHQQESLLGKFGSLMNPKRQKSMLEKSPVPSRAARRVTANDLASLDDVDNWSIDSYETPVKSPTDGELYRGWKESRGSDPAPQSRKERLSLPYFK